MKAFARITGIIFVLFGVGTMLFAFTLPLSSLANLKSIFAPSESFLTPNLAAFTILLRIIGGGVIGIQGLFIAAIGQVLWLLAHIAEQTERTSLFMASFVRQLTLPKA